MASKLKPCPFCGGEAIYGKREASGRVRAVCVDCLASTDWLAGTDEAAAAWNRCAERTWRMEYNERWSHDEYYPTECYNCSECGHMTYDGVPTFCPDCGARVVDDGRD